MTSNPRITPPRPADTIGWVDFLRVLAVFLVVLAYDLFDIAGLAPWARILCGSVVASAASLVLCLIFYRWRPTRRLIA